MAEQQIPEAKPVPDDITVDEDDLVPESPETSTEPAPEPAKPKHFPGLVSLARDFGVDQAEIDGSTPEELDRLVSHLSRQQRRLEVQKPVERQPVPTEPEDEIDWGEA